MRIIQPKENASNCTSHPRSQQRTGNPGLIEKLVSAIISPRQGPYILQDSLHLLHLDFFIAQLPSINHINQLVHLPQSCEKSSSPSKFTHKGASFDFTPLGLRASAFANRSYSSSCNTPASATHDSMTD